MSTIPAIQKLPLWQKNGPSVQRQLADGLT